MKKIAILFLAAVFIFCAGDAFAGAGDIVLDPVLLSEIESTDKSGDDETLITGTAGTSTYAAVWDANGDLVDGPGVPAITDLSNIASTAIPVSLISDTAGTDDLGTEAIFWQTLYLKSIISFEGATDNEFQTSLTVTDPTADHTITIPASDQTIGVATSAAADAIDAITEIAAALKTGADTKLCTGTAGADGNVATWDASGDLVDGGAVAPGSFGTGVAQTAASGIITTTANENFVIVTGEGDVADAITEVVLTSGAVGDIMVFKGKTGLAYDLTWTDGAYLELQGGANFVMNNEADMLTLVCTTLGANEVFTEIARSSGN